MLIPTRRRNGRASHSKAMAAGAKFRPLTETIRDTTSWVKNGRGDGMPEAGMSAEREQELLAKRMNR